MRDFADSFEENAVQNTTENTVENTTKTQCETLGFVVGHANALAKTPLPVCGATAILVARKMNAAPPPEAERRRHQFWPPLSIKHRGQTISDGARRASRKLGERELARR